MTYQQYLSKYKLDKLPGERKLLKATETVKQINELCGDGMTFYFLVEKGVVKDIGFDGYGCFLSRLSSSLLAKKCIGKPVGAIKKWDKEKLLALLGFPVTSVREQCVLMPLKAFQKI